MFFTKMLKEISKDICLFLFIQVFSFGRCTLMAICRDVQQSLPEELKGEEWIDGI